MNTIITNSPPITRFHLCDPTAIRESQFEGDVIRVLNHLYPKWKIFKFQPNVYHGGAVWKPDLAIVDSKHEYWFIVEVEIVTHHLEKHVLPQVTALLYGDYSKSAASLLADAIGISKQSASTLLAYVPREVVVISNRRDEAWDQKLGALGVQHLVISEYRNALTQHTLHSVDGDIIPVQKSLGFGRVRATDQVIVTQARDFWRNDSYQICGPEGISAWQCSVDAKGAWLMKKRGLIEFQDDTIVQFLLSSENQIIVRQPYALKE